MKEKYTLALSLVKEAGELIKNNLRVYNVNTKSSEKDLVTDIDILVEEFICSKLKDQYQGDFILAEECTVIEEIELTKNLWVLDPIDGTVNFIHQQKNFAISLAYYEKQQAIFGIVYDVMTGDLYTCYKGEGAFLNGTKLKPLTYKPIKQSLIGFSQKWLLSADLIDYIEVLQRFRNYRYHGVASLEMCYVATGILDCYLTCHLKPWDYAAAKLILEELGGKVVTLNGKTLTGLEFTDFIAGHKNVVNEFLKYNKS